MIQEGGGDAEDPFDVPGDLALGELAEMRAVTDVPIDQSHATFATAFRQQFGRTPSDVRKDALRRGGPEA